MLLDKSFETALLGVLQNDLNLPIILRYVKTIVFDYIGVIEFLQNSYLCLQIGNLPDSFFFAFRGYFHDFQGIFQISQLVNAAIDVAVGATADQLHALVDFVEAQLCVEGSNL